MEWYCEKNTKGFDPMFLLPILADIPWPYPWHWAETEILGVIGPAADGEKLFVFRCLQPPRLLWNGRFGGGSIGRELGTQFQKTSVAMAKNAITISILALHLYRLLMVQKSSANGKLRLVVYPVIYRSFFYIQTVVFSPDFWGPSTVGWGKEKKTSLSGDSWMYPDPNVPRHGKSGTISPFFSGCTYVRGPHPSLSLDFRETWKGNIQNPSCLILLSSSPCWGRLAQNVERIFCCTWGPDHFWAFWLLCNFRHIDVYMYVCIYIYIQIYICTDDVCIYPRMKMYHVSYVNICMYIYIVQIISTSIFYMKDVSFYIQEMLLHHIGKGKVT